MAATKAELLFPEPLACVPAPLSPLDGYSKLEELQMLLQNAAAGGSLLAAEAAGLLGGESDYGGEEREDARPLSSRLLLMQNFAVFAVKEYLKLL